MGTVLEDIGKKTIDHLDYVGSLNIQVLSTLRAMRSALPLIGNRYRWQATVRQMLYIGYDALPMVSLMAVCTGFILAMHSLQVIGNERRIEMRVEQVYRQSLQMAHFVANRCHIPPMFPSLQAAISRVLIRPTLGVRVGNPWRGETRRSRRPGRGQGTPGPSPGRSECPR